MDTNRTTMRVWVGECEKHTFFSQLANIILTSISPGNVGNHNKKLLQLLQNILAQFFGEVEACISAHGSVEYAVLGAEFTNSLSVLFERVSGSAAEYVLPDDFANVLNTHTSTNPDVFNPFILHAVSVFVRDVKVFIDAWCRTYDKIKPDAHPLEMLLHCKFGTDQAASFTINNLVATKVTTAHSISKQSSRSNKKHNRG